MPEVSRADYNKFGTIGSLPAADAGPRQPNAGYSTCPICNVHWLVTPMNDCCMPACECFGMDTSEKNPNRPCTPCGINHFTRCSKRHAAPPVPQEAAPRKTREQVEAETPILKELYCSRCDAYHSAGWHRDEVNVASWATQATAPDSAMRVAVEVLRRFGQVQMPDDDCARTREAAALIREAGSEREREVVELCAKWLEHEAELINHHSAATLQIAAKGLRASRLLGGESK